MLSRALVVVLAVLAASGCARQAPSVAPAPDSGRVDSTVDAPTRVVVQAGDSIRMRIWREPDLSGDFAVGEDGRVVLPKLGGINAAGLEASVLRDSIVKTFSQWLRNPSIDVSISRRVTVLGEIEKPGSYVMDPTNTVANLLSVAGGITSKGDKQKVSLVRQGTVLRAGIRPTTTLAQMNASSGDEVVVGAKTGWARYGPMARGVAVSTLGLAILVFRVWRYL